MTCELCIAQAGIYDFSRACCKRRMVLGSFEFYVAALKSAVGEHQEALALVEKHPDIADDLRALVKTIRKGKRDVDSSVGP